MRLTESLRRIKRKFFPSKYEYFPVDAWTDSGYEDWFLASRASAEELEIQRKTKFGYNPKFSIIVPLFKTPIDYLTMMAESVLSQTYENLELILVNASPEEEELAAAIQAVIDFDERVHVVSLDGNYGITENTNYGIDAATGDFIGFLDHDDFIEPNLLFEYARALNEDESIDVLYCDEDMVEIDQQGIHHLHPLFKPEYSPELLLCKNYMIHLMTIRAEIVREIERPDASYDGSQDYNMALKSTQLARQAHGVQKVLYHWRIHEGSTATNPESKLYTRRAGRKAAFSRIQDEFPGGKIVASGIRNNHNVWMDCAKSPKVTLIVDCADAPDRFGEFLESLIQANAYQALEIIPVNADIAIDAPHDPKEGEIRPMTVREKKQFERLNAAASLSTGDFLVFLKASDFFVTPDAIEQLAGICGHGQIGVVASKCLYVDDSVMSFGMAVTPERIMPLYRGYPDEFPAYQCNTRSFQNVSAVDWRGMIVSRELFAKLGGFDATYEGPIGGADFCQKVLREGLRIVQTPTVKVQTNMLPPEGRYDCIANSKDFTEKDLELFDSKWPGVRMAGDPYFNRNFDQSSEYCQIAGARHVKR